MEKLFRERERERERERRKFVEERDVERGKIRRMLRKLKDGSLMGVNLL